MRVVVALLMLVACEAFVSPAGGTPVAQAGSVTREPDLKDGDLAGPFTPRRGKEVGRTTGRIFFINGRATDANKAREYAQRTADQLGREVYLIFNDLTLPIIDDIAIGLDKLGDGGTSLNEATATLVREASRDIKKGLDINVICFSGGTIITNNAVRQIAEGYGELPERERDHRLGRIHIVTVASAVLSDRHVFADGWPEKLGSLFHLYHAKDPVSAMFGPGEGDCEDLDLDVHDYASVYLPALTPAMLRESGTKVLGAQAPPEPPSSVEPEGTSAK